LKSAVYTNTASRCLCHHKIKRIKSAQKAPKVRISQLIINRRCPQAPHHSQNAKARKVTIVRASHCNSQRFAEDIRAVVNLRRKTSLMSLSRSKLTSVQESRLQGNHFRSCAKLSKHLKTHFLERNVKLHNESTLPRA